MGGVFEDNLLNDQVRGAIHDFTLKARRVLMDETRDLLEGVYGLHTDGRFESPENLPTLSDPETRETYDRLVGFLKDEFQAGLAPPEAVEKLRKEIAFTHLNRLVAFKMMEKSKLIREAVGRGTKSNGFLFYLADHPKDEVLWQAGKSEIAYQHFLLWQAGQIAQEIKVLFDPDSLPSKLFPREQTVQVILNMINAADIAPAWDADETIGWIYQFFNEQEKADVFDRLYKQKEKMRREDIPAATQLFTPRWIVRFLVENTLGKTWVEMHPDSELKEKLRYLVPNPQREQGTEKDIEIKPVNEITLLDPACGTMHFGVLAFDLFAEMYREEILRAGDPGWPETPSVEVETEIPAAILANNLFGIDIDLRAVQLSALSLYLKAKSLNKDTIITRHNLACADVLTLNGKRLGEFIKDAQFSRPIYERLIRALWEKLEDINQIGSLLRLEQEVETLMGDERARYEREGRQTDMFVNRSVEFEAAAAKEEYWAILGGQIIQAIDHFAKAQAEAGADQSFFAGEAIKGMQVLDLMLREYDVVVTNPPYMGYRNMNNLLSDFLKNHYSDSKGDLYAAFIQRCSEFVNPMGRVGMITQQSFMFISSYESLRANLRNQFVVEAMAHTGPRAFAEISGEKVNTTVFTIKYELDQITRHNHIGTYFRLVHEPDAKSKQDVFEKMIAALQFEESIPGIYLVAQGRFDAIPGSPWVYKISEEFRKLYETQPLLSNVAQPRQGLTTADNFRFIRFWWETELDQIALGCVDGSDAQKSGKKWFPLVKGGQGKRWYGGEISIGNWQNDGKEIKSYIVQRYPYLNGKWEWVAKNPASYFLEGAAYSAVSSSGLFFRWMPKGYICEHASNAVYSESNEWPPILLVGLFNSDFAHYAVGIYETININIDDLLRTPIFSIREPDELLKLIGQCVHIRYYEDTYVETYSNFIIPILYHASNLYQQKNIQLQKIEKNLSEKIHQYYGLPEYEAVKIRTELKGKLSSQSSEDIELFSEENITETPVTQDELAATWISYAIGIILGRFLPGKKEELGSSIFHREDFSIDSLSMPDEFEFNGLVGLPEKFPYIDENGGRHVFSLEIEQELRDLAIPDGIATLDEGHPRDLANLVEKALVLMLGEDDSREVIRKATGDPSIASLRKFLMRDFFTKWHFKWYKKRPVYWPIQSNNRSYGFVINHERINKDTFFAIQRKPFLEAKRNAIQYEQEEIEARLRTATGRARKQLEKELDKNRKLADELAEFTQALERITLGSDGLPGYTPEEDWVDDGVILRMAPLWEVIPIWKSEPKKYWERLQKGDYDWSHIAMHYWPMRVKEKCKMNKSFAIAHGHEEWFNH